MLAQDIMTRAVLTVAPDSSLVAAASRMLEARISGLPVVDEAGNLVGILTEGDLLRRAETGTDRHHSGWIEFLMGSGRLATEYVQSHAKTVSDLMTAPVASVLETTDLGDIVTLMERRHIRRVPVIRGDALVGLVSRADILRELLLKLDTAPASTAASDAVIHDTLCAELNGTRWANTHNICVDVRDGVVTLEGALFNEAVRPALRVAAENTAGVKRVDDLMTWVQPLSGMALGA